MQLITIKLLVLYISISIGKNIIHNDHVFWYFAEMNKYNVYWWHDEEFIIK